LLFCGGGWDREQDVGLAVTPPGFFLLGCVGNISLASNDFCFKLLFLLLLFLLTSAGENSSADGHWGQRSLRLHWSTVNACVA
jgi:hypothetical protein